MPAVGEGQDQQAARAWAGTASSSRACHHPLTPSLSVGAHGVQLLPGGAAVTETDRKRDSAAERRMGYGHETAGRGGGACVHKHQQVCM